MSKVEIGMIFKSNNFGDFIVKEYRGYKGNQRRFLIQFIETNFLSEANYNEILKGEVKDVYAKKIFNKGCIGKVDRKNYKREYQLWHNMLQRCYDEKFHIDNPTYKDCEVEEKWLCFENFLEDINQIENYHLWVNNLNYELDKDTKISGNKLYSLETCKFISRFNNRSYSSKLSNAERKIPIVAINKITNEEIYFNSQHEAQRKLDIDVRNINAVLKGRQQSAKGFFLKYINSGN